MISYSVTRKDELIILDVRFNINAQIKKKGGALIVGKNRCLDETVSKRIPQGAPRYLLLTPGKGYMGVLQIHHSSRRRTRGPWLAGRTRSRSRYSIEGPADIRWNPTSGHHNLPHSVRFDLQKDLETSG